MGPSATYMPGHQPGIPDVPWLQQSVVDGVPDVYRLSWLAMAVGAGTHFFKDKGRPDTEIISTVRTRVAEL